MSTKNTKGRSSAKGKAISATERLVGVGAFIKKHLLAGKTNEQVWKLAVKKYGLGDEKRYYPAWYRGQMRRAEAAQAS